MFNQLNGDESIEQLRDEVARMQKTMNHLLRHLSSKNVKEIGGYFVTPTDIVSKDGDVGISSEDTGLDDVRFFAGSVNKETAPFKVRQSGKMEATGAVIQSKSGYPKVVLDPDGNLIGAYRDANNFVEMVPEIDGAPSFVFTNSGVEKGAVFGGNAGFFILAVDGNLSLTAWNDVIIESAVGTVKFEGWNKVYSTGNGRTLQQELDRYAVNMTFDPITRNLKLFNANGSQIAIVNIPDSGV